MSGECDKCGDHALECECNCLKSTKKNIIEYPKNISAWWSDGRDEEFNLWAFGCLQPGLNKGVIECWENLHPEYPMTVGDSIWLCICKMNYLYQQQKKRNEN